MSYDNFFKQARQARQGDKNSKRSAKKAAPSFQMNESRASTPTEVEQVLRQKLNVKPVRRKASFPIVPLLVLAAISTLLGWWSVDPELPDRILRKVNISMMGGALAADAEKPAKNAQAKGDAKAKGAAGKNGEANPDRPAEVATVNEDLSHLDKLRERKTGLDQREKELNELEEELQKQKSEIEARIKHLEDLRAQITTVLKDRVEVDQEKVMKLVETYSNMKPKQAAEILAGVDEDLAVEVLGKMKKKNAAEIMNLLEPAKARTLSEKYAGYKSR